MTKRISKHGTRYTEGSQSTFGGWESRTCCICGQLIVKSRQNARFSLSDQHGARSWHTDCEQPGPDWPGQPHRGDTP